jgi:hypothetical protein
MIIDLKVCGKSKTETNNHFEIFSTINNNLEFTCTLNYGEFPIKTVCKMKKLKHYFFEYK